MNIVELFEKHPKGTKVRRKVKDTSGRRISTIFSGKLDHIEKKTEGWIFWLVDDRDPVGLSGKTMVTDGWEVIR